MEPLSQPHQSFSRLTRKERITAFKIRTSDQSLTNERTHYISNSPRCTKDLRIRASAMNQEVLKGRFQNYGYDDDDDDIDEYSHSVLSPFAFVLLPLGRKALSGLNPASPFSSCNTELSFFGIPVHDSTEPESLLCARIHPFGECRGGHRLTKT